MDKLDTANYDEEFTSMTPKDSVVGDTPLSQTDRAEHTRPHTPLPTPSRQHQGNVTACTHAHTRLYSRTHLHPTQMDKLDTTNFDEEFTSMTPKDSVVGDTPLSQTVQNQFQGFTYVDGGELGRN